MKVKDRLSLLSNYPAPAGGSDEMFHADGSILPQWKDLITHFHGFKAADFERLRVDTQRQIRENGVTYTVHGDPTGVNRPWQLDPVPLVISESDWANIEKGLQQRAHLLDAILDDLYGPQKLIHEGLLPMELVYHHSGFLRPCVHVPKVGKHRLLLSAADLARGPDGNIWVVNDRTEAPSGSGYSLENRVIMARLLRQPFHNGRVRRLANFFHALLETLHSLVPENNRDPRGVLLTPGPFNEAYFEHAYLAAYLNFTLVQGDDLTVRDDRVWMKSLGGLKPVDIILRRLNSPLCDPLELREDSLIGVPGLLEVARRGKVVLANPLGSGILENPGFMAFLPGLARHLLGEELLLPSAATWWCGQEKERSYVLANLDRMVIKMIHRRREFTTLFGEQLSKEALRKLRAEIQAKPHLFVGQERVSFSTAPSLVEGKLAPRHAVWRTFMAAHKDGYCLMPGGLTRSALEEGNDVVSERTGGIAKDTWVTGGDRHEPFVSLWNLSEVGTPVRHEQRLPSRAGENLFWAGRYAERTEVTSRLVRRVLRSYFESINQADAAGEQFLGTLLLILTDVALLTPGFRKPNGRALTDEPEPALKRILMDDQCAGGVSSALRGFLNTAYNIRDLWSADTWRVIDSMEAHWNDFQTRPDVFIASYRSELNRLITGLNALAGLCMESMTREAGWRLLDTGRRIERAQLLIRLLQATLVKPFENETVSYLVMESVLAISDSLVTHRRRYRSSLRVSSILELLLLDEDNPRSLLFQLDRIQGHVSRLPRESSLFQLTPEERIILEAHSQLRLCDISQLVKTSGRGRPALAKLLQSLTRSLTDLSEVLTRTYFSHASSVHQLRG